MKKLFTLLTLCCVLTSCASAGTKADPVLTVDSNSESISENVQETNEVQDDKPKEDIILTMAIVTTDLGAVEKMIAPFNEADNGYKIQLKSYFDGDALSGEADEMAAIDFQVIQDLLNTDEIDIISTYSFANDSKFEILKKRGLYADLYQFMENDPEVNKDTLNNHILSFHEVDGKLMSMPIRYGIDRTLYGKKEYVGDKENWSVDDFINAWENMPEGSTVCGSINAEAVYGDILGFNMENFVDYDNAEVHFDSDEFRRILEFCKQFPSNNGQKSEYNYDAPRLLELCGIYGFIDSSIFDDEHTVVGYPSNDGSGAILKDFAPRYAINSHSSPEKQQGAWEFIRSFVTVEGLMTDYIEEHRFPNPDTGLPTITYDREYGFPVNNEAFEMQMQDMISGKYSYWSEVSEKDKSLGYESHMCNVADAEKCERLVEYINSINRWETNIDRAVWSIVTEEVISCLRGEKTVDEAVNMIQNRTSLWISEQS